MGFLYRTVLLLILSVFVMELAAQDQSGMQVSVTDYLLPQYRKKKENLQFVIYGDTAINKGAIVILNGARISLMNENIDSLEKANIFIPSKMTADEKKMFFTPYPIYAGKQRLKEFWEHANRATTRAWIFTTEAEYDRNTRLLRSDKPASFRSRELDADGIGFDANQQKKHIFIRSKVRAVFHFDFAKTETTETSQEK